MNVTAIRTDYVHAGDDLFCVLDEALPKIGEQTVIAVTSKIVSLCENRVVPLDAASKEDLIARESARYLPKSCSRYGHHFSITNNTLIPSAGIDESNADNYYVLWPKAVQESANRIREYLKQKHNLKDIGVIITDSTCQPLRRGSTGIVLAHSGFRALNDYRGQPDLFGRTMAISVANVANGLAASAVLAMGEGSERTPICQLRDMPFVAFQDRNPTAKELALANISLEEDLFAPFLDHVPWKSGKQLGGN
jgi:putative folate metabolism gamma-glutamate ligase